MGIIPDITVEETADIFQGKDVVLDKGLEVLSGQSEHQSKCVFQKLLPGDKLQLFDRKSVV